MTSLSSQNPFQIMFNIEVDFLPFLFFLHWELIEFMKLCSYYILLTGIFWRQNTHNVGLRSTEEAGPETALPLAELKCGTKDLDRGQRLKGEAPDEAGQGQYMEPWQKETWILNKAKQNQLLRQPITTEEILIHS